MPKGDRLRLGQEVRRARRAAGMTQIELAMLLGVHKITVSNWERGVYAISGDVLARLESELDVRVRLVPTAFQGDS